MINLLVLCVVGLYTSLCEVSNTAEPGKATRGVLIASSHSQASKLVALLALRLDYES
jgi:hypothetical protein